MTRLYRHQARIFDPTRRPVLLDRRHLARAVQPGDTVLEVGCGTGANLRCLAAATGPAGRVVGMECAPTMARRARRRAARMRGRPGLGHVEVREGEFPAVTLAEPIQVTVFSYVLSMLPDPATALESAHRMLTPAGRVVILDFTDAKFAWLQRHMTRFGVHLGAQWAADAAAVFHIQEQEHRVAWWGLWNYQYVVAVRRAKAHAMS